MIGFRDLEPEEDTKAWPEMRGFGSGCSWRARIPYTWPWYREAVIPRMMQRCTIFFGKSLGAIILWAKPHVAQLLYGRGQYHGGEVWGSVGELFEGGNVRLWEREWPGHFSKHGRLLAVLFGKEEWGEMDKYPKMHRRWGMHRIRLFRDLCRSRERLYMRQTNIEQNNFLRNCRYCRDDFLSSTTTTPPSTWRPQWWQEMTIILVCEREITSHAPILDLFGCNWDHTTN